MKRTVPTGSSFYGRTDKGSAYSTKFSSADTFLGRRRKMVLRISRRLSWRCLLKGLIGADQRGLPPLAARVKSYILQGHSG